MYNNPFFTSVPGIGNLDLEEVLVDDICPIFFTLVSKEGSRYISICCELYTEQRWIIAPISNADLIKVLTNELSIRYAFFTQNDKKCIIAHWSKGDPILRYEAIDSSGLPVEDLPFDEMLDAEDGEFEEYIRKIQDSNI